MLLLIGSVAASASPAQAATTTNAITDPDAYGCSQPGYIDFEEFSDQTNLSAETFTGVQFTTTGGYTWMVGDFATGSYNGKYPSGSYTSQGTHWAWLGTSQGAGRIDLSDGPASYFSILTSALTPVYLEAYDDQDQLLEAAGPSSSNAGTGGMDELIVDRATADIAYLLVHDSGNYFLVDSVCTDAPGVPTTGSKPPVLIIHGIEVLPPYADCAVEWDDAKSYLRENGYSTRELLTVGYYEGDSNCDRVMNDDKSPTVGEDYFYGTDTHASGTSGGHTNEAAIEHLSYHLAWFIYDDYSKNGVKVDVLAHSMGGLMIRYAIGQVSNHNPAFPPKLLVEDVVAFGSPHGGAKWSKRVQCKFNGFTLGLRQCSEMKPGSAFLTGLETAAWNPQGEGGTDWTAVGSDGDESVAADRAVGTNGDRTEDLYFGACHKVWYPTKWIEMVSGSRSVVHEQTIGHNDYRHDGSVLMTATDLAAYTSGSHCGAPLSAAFDQPHPMGMAGLALDSPDY